MVLIAASVALLKNNHRTKDNARKGFKPDFNAGIQLWFKILVLTKDKVTHCISH